MRHNRYYQRYRHRHRQHHRQHHRRYNPSFSISGENFYCACSGCTNEVTADSNVCFFCREADCMSHGDCQAKGFQGLRRNPYFRNPDDLLFADTADEALLSRQELLRRQRSRRRPATSLSPQQYSRPAVKTQPRCLAVPTKTILDQLSAYNTDDVIRRALGKAVDLCPENINAGDWQQLQNRLEELAQTPRRLRRYNPLSMCVACGMRRNPGESTATLARRTLTKLRQSRAKAGFDVFRHRYRHRNNPRKTKGDWHGENISPKHLKKLADKDFTYVSVYIFDEEDPNHNVPHNFVLWLAKPKDEIQKRAEKFIKRVYGKSYDFHAYPRNYVRDAKDLAAIGLHEDASTSAIEKVFEGYRQQVEEQQRQIAEYEATLEARNRQEQEAGTHEDMQSMRSLEQYTGTYIGDMDGMSIPMYRDARGHVHVAPSWMAKYPVGQKFRNGEPVKSLRGGRRRP